MNNNNISRYLAVLLGFLIVGFVVYKFSNLVTYILVAWVLSLVGQPLMRLLRKIHVGKVRMGPNFSALLTLLTFFIVGTLLFVLFVPLALEQAYNLAGVNYSEIAATLQEPFDEFKVWMAGYGVDIQEGSLEESLRQSLSGWFDPSSIGDIISTVIGAAGNIVLALFSIIFITFFFLKEQGLFVNSLVAIIPPKYEAQTRESIKDIVYLLSRYFSGILLQISIITLYMSIMLSIFGVKNAFLIALFAAFINVIPYLGPLIGAAFGIFITISSNLDMAFYTELLPLLIKVVIIFASMQMLDNFILQPFIFSNSVLAHPLEIFLVILMGASLMGITGMVLAIPTYTVIRVVAREFLNKFELVKRLTRKMDEADI
jgi:predicted PurR-regulated permease PerM